MTPFQNASQWIDAANAEDPNQEIYQSKTYPKELLYSNRMYERLMNFHPNASEEVQRHADFVTSGVDDEGIVHALKHFHIGGL